MIFIFVFENPDASQEALDTPIPPADRMEFVRPPAKESAGSRRERHEEALPQSKTA